MSSLCPNLTMPVAHELSASRGKHKNSLDANRFVQKYGFQREIVERIIKIDPYSNAPKCCHVNCYSKEHEFVQYIWCSAFCTCNNAFL